MKLETIVYDKFKKIMPQDSLENIIFADVEDTSYEIFFYTWLTNGDCMQCYELTAEGSLNENTLENIFEEIYRAIKTDKQYIADKRNIFTFKISKNNGIELYVEHYDKTTKMYTIKKEWKKKFIEN